MMGISYALKEWAACGPGLATPEGWLAWAQAPRLCAGPLESPLAAMAPMLRRRLSPLGRAAAQAAWDCHPTPSDIPVVLASRYGDAERALRLLASAASDEALSPTDFALSVHNAIGGVYSIARGDTAPSTSIAAGAASAAAGLVEAAGLLADGASEVLLVCYDAALPAPYAGFADEPACTYAWAWRVAPALRGQPFFSLQWAPAAHAPDTEAALPFGLDLHRFAISGDASLTLHSQGTRWTWTLHV